MNFRTVDKGVFAGGIPFPNNYEFLKTLNLKTVIVLSPECLDEKTAKFFTDNNIEIINCHDRINWDDLQGLFPVADEIVTEALQVMSNKDNLPLLVMCRTGTNLTGVVVACLRKLQQWSLAAIVEEYRRFAGLSRLQKQHEQFVQIFDTDLIKITENAPAFLTNA